MKTLDALLERKSVRAYLDKTVDHATVMAILEHAKHAPSGVNMQPWRVCIVSGSMKRRIETKVIQAFEAGEKARMDYRYYPPHWEEPYRSRRKETGLQMYRALGIGREDKAAQAEQWKANYRAFDAPVVLYFFIDAALEKGSWLDYGMFLQSVMIAATSLGLGSCPQAALAEYPYIVRDVLGIGSDKTLLCGMALGYEDKTAPINGYRTARVPLESFAAFYDA
ncbi:nitroreductase [Sulfurimonas sp. HSL-3221]|uniref:nitroreductase n=1 Tax=Sulfurimonadaceae TaxID=2771471 RepID=UPI001E41CB3C|nr:nitroreductase [Sulfurimonas sp. HSL-3221]UFS61374.1 nitroreductase [Sulfurimonas sp. HSL-3221]